MTKVYIKTDESGQVTEVASGQFLTNTDGWQLIDEGTGDRFVHAQGNYLPDGLTDENGNYNYTWENGALIRRGV